MDYDVRLTPECEMAAPRAGRELWRLRAGEEWGPRIEDTGRQGIPRLLRAAGRTVSLLTGGHKGTQKRDIARALAMSQTL